MGRGRDGAQEVTFRLTYKRKAVLFQLLASSISHYSFICHLKERCFFFFFFVETELLEVFPHLGYNPTLPM